MRSFSIVIPNYNGVDYLRLSLQSALAQTYSGPFEVVVLDAGSTDGALEYLRSIQDERLVVHPSATPLDMLSNWQRLNSLRLNEFVTFIGQDDLLEPNYLEVMDKLIAANPEGTLFHAHFNFIDRDGNLIRRCRDMPTRESAGEYLAALFSGSRDTHGAGYMFSSELFARIGGLPNWHRLLFADDALWFLLMEPGYKACSTETVFSIRLHKKSTGSQSTAADWLGAMERYITFLRELAARDTGVAESLALWAGSYYLMWSNVVLEKHLVERTRQNLPADPAFLSRIEAILRDVDPGQLPAWGQGRKIKIHRTINSSVAGRGLYKVYGKLRGQ